MPKTAIIHSPKFFFEMKTTKSFFSIIFLFFVLFACETKNETEIIPKSIEIVSGNYQSGKINSTLEAPIVIIARDENNKPLKNTLICFTETSNNNTKTIVRTTEQGTASFQWQCTSHIGNQQLLVDALSEDEKTEVFEKSLYLTAIVGEELVEDIDGNLYPTVTIGTQTWLSKNLQAKHYSNGEEIESIRISSQWTTFEPTTKACVHYSQFDSEKQKELDGLLYTWAAATNGLASSTANEKIQGVCPVGYHIPNQAEWDEMLLNVGQDETTAKLLLNDTAIWKTSEMLTNSSGFSAAGSGYINSTVGVFDRLGTDTFFWTSNVEDNDYGLGITMSSSYIIYSPYLKTDGFSVRCVKD